VAVMNGGKIIANGAPDEVIRASMIEKVYGIKADIITHGAHARCVPVFHKALA